MKPSKNAFIGYTYQEQVTFLLLVIMDVKRYIDSIEIEADVDNNFEDVKIITNKSSFYCQIKDFESVDMMDLKITKNEIYIKRKKHTLSTEGVNVILFKNIDILPNDTFLGIPAYRKENILMISLSRVKSENLISSLYDNNEKRILILKHFFSDCLDKRVLKINKENLPIINVFDTTLVEKSIEVGRNYLDFSNILFIEGKPGVGKSHYVNTLSKTYKNNIVYRFWVSNQDKDYKARLVYKNFLSDISKKIFGDYIQREEIEIIEKLNATNRTIIIDGLDHVENYNYNDLQLFVDFIDKLSIKSKTIILSRPLRSLVLWEKQILNDWNKEETQKVLNDLYHISNYSVCNKIYKLTSGYPILVRFVTEHYKRHKEIPVLNNLKDVDDYYNQILKDVHIKSALTLFLTSQSFFMKSELKMFLSDELLDCITDFIDTYPYLFEIRLNRVSLFHDSLNKYLRELDINYSKRKEKVNELVYNSILGKDKRFMSRVSYFELDYKKKKEVVKKFSSIEVFREITNECIDFEAIRSFYIQIRELLKDLYHTDLDVKNYYDLSLILNIVYRDHISTLNEFLYTYVKCLLFNGYTIENITSSEYLFSMFVYCLDKDATLLYNTTSNSNYNTIRFIEQLENNIHSEENFFLRHKKPVKLINEIAYYIKDNYNWREHLTLILTNLYIHKTSDESLLKLQRCIDTFIDINEAKGIGILEQVFNEYGVERDYPHWVLNDVKKNLLSLGKLQGINQYLGLSLKDYILENRSNGSFDMWVGILNYLRLSLERKQKINISDVALFWRMYGMRKDYTVINVDEALKVFETNNLTNEINSVKQIVFIQSMSEKGIRHLLTEYISIHSPDIIKKIETNFCLDDLNVNWFKLPYKHINEFSNKVYNHAVRETMQNHRYSRDIDFKDIKNVFYSIKWLDLIDKLKFFKCKVRILEDSPEIKEIEKTGIGIVTDKNEKNYVTNNSEYKYNKGLLGIEDKEYVLEKKLTLSDISGHLSYNYSALTNLELLELFPKEKIAENLQLVFYNSILGKINNLNYFGTLFYFVGNLPKLVNDNFDTPNIEKLYNSFNTFLELSLLNLTENE